jgi:acylphosphatase
MSSVPSTAVHLLIQGRVQGVGYRYFAQETAVELKLSGWVRNVPDGSVEACAEGQRATLETWIHRLRQGPPASRVEAIQIAWSDPQGSFQTFSIR